MNTLQRDFIVVDHDLKHKRVVRINKEGELVWQYGIDRALDLQLLEHGGCLINGRTYDVELDKNQQEIWRYTIDAFELMSCRRLNNGNTLIGDLTIPSIYELTVDLQKVWEMPFPHDNEADYHELFRMVRPLRNGNLLIAWHTKQKVAEFTKAGHLVWEFTLEAGPYEALELANGNYLVSVGPAGAIVEINKETGLVWEFRMEHCPRLTRGWIAGLVPLPDGNIVFSDSKGDQIIEINRKGEVVGVFHQPDVLLHPSSLVLL